MSEIKIVLKAATRKIKDFVASNNPMAHFGNIFKSSFKRVFFLFTFTIKNTITGVNFTSIDIGE